MTRNFFAKLFYFFRKLIFVIAMLSVVCSISCARAEETKVLSPNNVLSQNNVLSLQEACNLALANSPALRSANNKLEAAARVIGETRSAYFPQLSADATSVRTDSGGTHVERNGVEQQLDGIPKQPSTITPKELDSVNNTEEE